MRHFGEAFFVVILLMIAFVGWMYFGFYDESAVIGGDEFVVLSRTTESLNEECVIFEEIVDGAARKTSYPFSVAYGVAVYDSQIDENVYDTVKRADIAMYTQKQAFKARTDC